MNGYYSYFPDTVSFAEHICGQARSDLADAVEHPKTRCASQATMPKDFISGANGHLKIRGAHRPNFSTYLVALCSTERCSFVEIADRPAVTQRDLLVLGAKSISGEITNTRLAMRKRRSGPGGEEFPFNVQSVELGVDQYGAQITSLIVQWGAKGKQEPERREHWSRSLRLLRQALMNVLVDHGREQRPFADGPLVRAVDIEIVRQEFYRSYPAEGDAAAKQAIRQKAFRRAVIAAQEQNLVGVREVDSLTLVWLINRQEGDA